MSRDRDAFALHFYRQMMAPHAEQLRQAKIEREIAAYRRAAGRTYPASRARLMLALADRLIAAGNSLRAAAHTDRIEPITDRV